MTTRVWLPRPTSPDRVLRFPRKSRDDAGQESGDGCAGPPWMLASCDNLPGGGVPLFVGGWQRVVRTVGANDEPIRNQDF